MPMPRAPKSKQAEEAEEELRRLNDESDRGEDAARAFADFARKLIAVPKEEVDARAARFRKRPR